MISRKIEDIEDSLVRPPNKIKKKEEEKKKAIKVLFYTGE